MARSIRAKFVVNGIMLTKAQRMKEGYRYDGTRAGYVGPNGEQAGYGDAMETYDQPKVVMNPVYAGPDASEEDKAFWEATPNGTLEMQVTRSQAAEFFELGETYYLVFSKAE